MNIHPAYVEWEEAKKEGDKFTGIFGKYHHTFWSRKGKISMIRMKNCMKKGDDFWEIYCLKGKLFEDTERFDKREDAMKRITELLEVEEIDWTLMRSALKTVSGVFAISFAIVVSIKIMRISDSFLIRIMCGTLLWVVLLAFLDWRDWVKK